MVNYSKGRTHMWGVYLISVDELEGQDRLGVSQKAYYHGCQAHARWMRCRLGARRAVTRHGAAPTRGRALSLVVSSARAPFACSGRPENHAPPLTPLTPWYLCLCCAGLHGARHGHGACHPRGGPLVRNAMTRARTCPNGLRCFHAALLALPGERAACARPSPSWFCAALRMMSEEPVARRELLSKVLGASALLGAAAANAEVDYAGVGYLGGASIIDVNNANIRVYQKLPGMYPNAAGKLVSNAPYKSKEEIYTKAKLSGPEAAAVKKYESK